MSLIYPVIEKRNDNRTSYLYVIHFLHYEDHIFHNRYRHLHDTIVFASATDSVR